MLPLLTSLALAAGLPDVSAPLPTGADRPGEKAVVIGLQDYVFLPDVPHAADDAAAFEAFLVRTRGVPTHNVQRLTQAGREQILAAVDQASTATDTVWIYLAGHGVAAPSTGERLFVGDDARQDPSAFEARSVALTELAARAGAGGADVRLVVDACFNGSARGGESLVDGTRYAVPSYAEPVAGDDALFAAAGSGQLARALDPAGHGAFTYALLGALRGWGDGAVDGVADGKVTAEEALVYVRDALGALGIRDQVPQFDGDGHEVWADGVSEPAPTLDEVAADIAPAGFAVVPSSGFPASLQSKAAAYDIALPVQWGPGGPVDAQGTPVARGSVRALVRSTPEGRRAVAMRTGGILAGIVGVGVGGFSGLIVQQGHYAQEYWPPFLIGTGVGIGGITTAVVGHRTARKSLEPR